MTRTHIPTRAVKLLASCVGLLAIAGAAHAQQTGDDNPGTLWPQAYHNPLLDRTARSVGDILTVIISETSTANFSASTTTTKKDSTTISQSVVPILKRLNFGILNDLMGAASTGANSGTSGSGSTSHVGNFSAKMSVLVKEVLPNGNLVIEGTRWVKVNKELQSFKLTGVVRRDDVRTDNTVLSESIADAQITADGKGTIQDRQRKGILTGLLDWLF